MTEVQLNYTPRRIIDMRQGRRSVVSFEGDLLLEPRWQPLYSKKQKNTLASQSISMFTGLTNADALDTNMQTDSMLPKGEEFSVYGLSLMIDYGTDLSDVKEFLNSGVLTFSISGHNYLQVPIHKIPSGGGLHGFSAVSTESAFQNGMPGAYYGVTYLGEAVHIVNGQAFKVVIDTYGSNAYSTAFDFTVYLDGVHFKPVLG